MWEMNGVRVVVVVVGFMYVYIFKNWNWNHPSKTKNKTKRAGICVCWNCWRCTWLYFLYVYVIFGSLPVVHVVPCAFPEGVGAGSKKKYYWQGHSKKILYWLVWKNYCQVKNQMGFNLFLLIVLYYKVI